MSRFAAAAVIADLSREISSTAAAIAIGDRLGLPCSNALRSRLRDRKSTRLNSSHSQISYAVFCLKKKNNDATFSHPCAHGGRTIIKFSSSCPDFPPSLLTPPPPYPSTFAAALPNTTKHVARLSMH